MTATAMETARERQLEWLLDEVLGNRAPRAARREGRAAMPRWLAAAMVVLAVAAAVAVALHEDPGAPIRPAPTQDPAPAIQWHDCPAPSEVSKIPDDVVNLRAHDFRDDTIELLARFPKLTRLDLSPGRIDENGVQHLVTITDVGVEKLARLTGLRWLCLGGCSEVEGKTLGALRAIPQLEHLDLSYTQVKTSGVRSLGTLPSLRELKLSGCLQFHGSALADVAKVPGLRRLELAGCASLSAADVAQLRRLSELRHLDLSNCLGRFLGQTSVIFDDFGPRQRQNRAAPEKAPVEDGVGVTDDAVASLRGLKVETLLLRGCRSITDAVAPHLIAMKALRSVDIGELPKTTTDVLPSLPAGLVHLSLSGNHHYDAAGLEALARFDQLTSLDITGLAAIDDPLLARILTGKQLVQLKMAGTPKSRDARSAEGHWSPNVTARCAAELAKQHALEELDLTATPWLDAAAARELAKLPRLRRLRLVWCDRVDATTLQELAPAPLRDLDLFGAGISDREAMEACKAWPGCSVRLPKGKRVTQSVGEAR